MDEHHSPAEQADAAGAVDPKSGYKSWKKKYRKMRIVFDKKMHNGEELYKQEAKASATVKRLAVENDRLLDLLLDINNSPQIPTQRRIDVALPSRSHAKTPTLAIDRNHTTQKEKALKRLEELLNDVPHSSYSVAKETNPIFVADLVAAEGEAHPANFLSAEDIDNYIHVIDSSIDHDKHLATLAGAVHPNGNQALNPSLKNPTSVTNWLRKHAPKIFLQDGETHADGDDAEGGHTGGRKSRGGRAERGGKASVRGKRASLAARVAERGDADASMDDDVNMDSTPVARGKRKRDDDGGYRPRGSSSRPTKKKRKSEGDGTPSARRSKKEAAAIKAE